MISTGMETQDQFTEVVTMPAFTALGYLGVSSHRLEEWGTFAAGMLGMQVADRSRHTMTLRMDDRRQRVMVADDGQRGYFGWEVRDRSDLDRLDDVLMRAGVASRPMTPAECRRRFLNAGLVFADPAGNQLEAVTGPEVDTSPFQPGRTHSGFRTGPLGLGHVVLTTPRVDELVTFYRNVLGFRLTDYCDEPFRARFLHLNARHHSLAVIEGPDVGVHHVMVEMNNIDDVGQAYDLALARPETIGVTLGRHSNDHMFSFYSQTPSDFLAECGWGGRSLDMTAWEPCELVDGPSLWGHERFWLSQEKRDEAFRMRVDAASRGSRAPVHVRAGNHDVADDVAPQSSRAPGTRREHRP